jgi:hypothetical protein
MLEPTLHYAAHLRIFTIFSAAADKIIKSAGDFLARALLSLQKRCG